MLVNKLYSNHLIEVNTHIRMINTILNRESKKYIYSSQYLVQTPLIGTTTSNITLIPPDGITITNITWAHNYKIVKPLDTSNVIAQTNGIYEVSFQCLENDYICHSIIEITNTKPNPYIKLLGLDGNIYGTFGTDKMASGLFILPIGVTAPYSYQIFVNNEYISDNPFITISYFKTNNIFEFIVSDCNGFILTADTSIFSS